MRQLVIEMRPSIFKTMVDMTEVIRSTVIYPMRDDFFTSDRTHQPNMIRDSLRSSLTEMRDDVT